MTVYYMALDGDPITGSKGGYVIAKPRFRELNGRHGALIGDVAFCATCGTTGTIAHGPMLRPGQRSTHDGIECAIGGDLVLCKCPTPPKIIPLYGRIWRIIDLPSGPKSAAEAFTSRICLECMIHAAENDASSMVRA
jgi:hypothetical protein